MNIALVSMMGNVGTTLNSQGGGYGIIQTRMLKDEHPSDTVDVNPKPESWNSYDMIYVCEGVNFVPGSFNIPGGPQIEHYDKMRAISEFKGEIRFSNSFFDFQAFNKRLKLDTEVPDPTKIMVYDTFVFHGLKHKKLVMGDSHALSVWRPNHSLHFTAGRTLHGFLKRVEDHSTGLIGYIHNFEDVTLYFGNIDLRFHLMRQTDPKQATKDLFARYVEFAKTLPKVTLVEPLPVEHESRKIPGTGLYKKQPFFGTRQERMELRDIACEVLNSSGLEVISWPKDWIDEDGTKMLDILEMKQSVHLRPKHYPYLNEIQTT